MTVDLSVEYKISDGQNNLKLAPILCRFVDIWIIYRPALVVNKFVNVASKFTELSRSRDEKTSNFKSQYHQMHPLSTCIHIVSICRMNDFRYKKSNFIIIFFLFSAMFIQKSKKSWLILLRQTASYVEVGSLFCHWFADWNSE